MLVRAATDGGGGAGSSSPLPHKTGNLMLLLLRVLGAGTPHNYGAVIYAESRRGCRLPAAVALGCNYKIGKCNVGQNNDPRTAGARRVAGSASKSSIRRFVITEKAPTRALNVKLGPRCNYHKGQAVCLA